MISSIPIFSSSLSLLEQAALVRRSEPAVEIEYLFKHGLVQETAYDSLLRNDRRQLHRFVAETLERDSARVEQNANLLAGHWENAGESERAFTYYILAAANAARVYANQEALTAYDHAAGLARDIELSAEQAQTLYQCRGRVLELEGDFRGALANYTLEQEWAMQRGQSAVELDALIRQATVFATPSDLMNFDRGLELSRRALEQARRSQDHTAEARVLWNLLLVHFFMGENDKAIAFGKESIAIARKWNLREQLAYTLNDIARAYLLVGRALESLQAMADAQELWRELNNLPMLADNLIGGGMACYITGTNYQAGRESANQGLEIAELIGNEWGQAYAHEIIGLLDFQSGHFADALEHSLLAADLGARVNFIDALVTGNQVVCLVYERLGAIDQSLRSLELLLALPNLSPIWSAVTEGFRAVILVEQGNPDKARAALEIVNAQSGGPITIEKLLLRMAKCRVLLGLEQFDAALLEARDAVDEMDTSGIRPFRSVMLLYQALALDALGQHHDALSMAQAASLEAQGATVRAWLWEILGFLAKMYRANGQLELSRKMQAEALAEIKFLAAHAPPDLAQFIYNRPDVRELASL